MEYLELKLDEIDMGVRFRQNVGDLTHLKESIKEKGLIQPISVFKTEEGRYMLIAGGRRLTAFQELGMETIPCMVRENVDELNLREMELIENSHRQDMSWQERFPLVEEIYNIQVLKSGEYGAQTRAGKLLGFERSYLSKILATNKAVKEVPELASETDHQNVIRKYNKIMERALLKKKRKVAKASFQKSEEDGTLNKDENTEYRKSQFLTRAENAFIVGDSLEKMESYRAEVACFAEVDPPYGVDFNKLRENKGSKSPGLEEYNEVPIEEYPTFLEKAAKQVYRILKDNTFCVWWHGSTNHQMVLEILEGVGFNVDKVPAIWYKEGMPGNVLNPRVLLARSYEPFFVCKKGGPEILEYPTNNVFPFAGVPAQSRSHPTERPVQLIRKLIQTFAIPEKSAHILVPFLGSGATIRAAFLEGFNVWGYDLSLKLKEDFLAKVEEEFESGVYDV